MENIENNNKYISGIGNVTNEFVPLEFPPTPNPYHIKFL